MAGNTLHHIRKLRSIPFTPFLSVREPFVFSRRTSVAWQTRALITVGYQFIPLPSSVALQLCGAAGYWGLRLFAFLLFSAESPAHAFICAAY